MKRTGYITVGLVTVVAAISSIAVGGSSAKGLPNAAGSAVSVRNTSVGPTLVDAQGRTLYLFAADRANVDTLSQAGFAVWPAFTASRTVAARAGASAAKIGTIRVHGLRQVTYNHHPLYYYVGDKKPGDTLGQGLKEFGALWYVLSPAGKAVTSVAHSTAPASGSSSSGYNYGY